MMVSGLMKFIKKTKRESKKTGKKGKPDADWANGGEKVGKLTDCWGERKLSIKGCYGMS